MRKSPKQLGGARAVKGPGPEFPIGAVANLLVFLALLGALLWMLPG